MTVSDIPTDTFNRIITDLCSAGWETVSEYNGMDAWIDYGRIELRQGDASLIFEWDNWSEGAIQGPDHLLQSLKEEYALP
ncbi:MAG: hypothetical protein H8F28_24925 [Fibrella sp.]|nr:hypothetical protein [Armatimonadota bacterium]